MRRRGRHAQDADEARTLRSRRGGPPLALSLCAPARAAPAPGDAATAVEDAGAELAARRAAGARLGFGPCPAVEELPRPVGCASLRVPLDYARPDGPQISLTVSRIPATGRGDAVRQGALVYNPGGPGASGMFFPLLGGGPAWSRIAAAYDLVGYAPRGVGRSAPLSCQDPGERPHGPTQVPAVPSPRTSRSGWPPPGRTRGAAHAVPGPPWPSTRP